MDYFGKFLAAILGFLIGALAYLIVFILPTVLFFALSGFTADPTVVLMVLTAFIPSIAGTVGAVIGWNSYD